MTNSTSNELELFPPPPVNTRATTVPVPRYSDSPNDNDISPLPKLIHSPSKASNNGTNPNHLLAHHHHHKRNRSHSRGVQTSDLDGTYPSKPQHLLSWYGVACVAVGMSLLSLFLHALTGLSGRNKSLGHKLLDYPIYELRRFGILSLQHSFLDSVLESVPDVPELPEDWSRVISLIATLSAALAVPLTHGLAGARRHGHDSSYHFWQPFVGGYRYVILQCLGWTIYSTMLIGALYLLLVGTSKVATSVLATVGLGGFISQILVLLSLRFFVTSSKTKVESRTAARIRATQLRKFRRAVSEGYITPEMERENATLNYSAYGTKFSEEKHQQETETDEAHRMKHAATSPISSPLFTHLTDRLMEIEKEKESTKQTVAEQGPDNVLAKLLAALSLSSASHHHLRQMIVDIYMDIHDLVIVGMVYCIPIYGALLTFLPFVIVYYFHSTWWVSPFMAVLLAAYFSTFRSRPHFTGHRSWDLVRKSKCIWPAMERYYSAKVITLGNLDPKSGPYVMAFHPHGVYPMTMYWATRGPTFAAAYPGLDVDVCGASIMFNCPLLREFCLWGGGREVSAASIRHALHSNRSIILVPGGQREMIHVKPVDEYVTYVTRHKGFVRLALECGVPLVPMISIGEQYSLQNLYLPKIQRWTLKHLGVGFPVFPYGRWYLPIPNRCPLTVIIGEPIKLPHIEHPTAEDVEKYHTEYYDQVRVLFDTYKAEAGFPNSELRYSVE